MKKFPGIVDRDDNSYEAKYYRARRQPFWAIVGLIGCTLVVLFSGWAPIYQLVIKSPGVKPRDAAEQIVGAYLGVCIAS